jgi:hypothetical protein
MSEYPRQQHPPCPECRSKNTLQVVQHDAQDDAGTFKCMDCWHSFIGETAMAALARRSAAPHVITPAVSAPENVHRRDLQPHVASRRPDRNDGARPHGKPIAHGETHTDRHRA